MIMKLLEEIQKECALTELENASRRFEASGMAFEAKAYQAKGLGHIGVMKAEGPMTMETLIINPFSVDAPIFSYDRIHAMGQEIMVAEMYDSLLGDTFQTEGMSGVAAMREADTPKPEYWYTPLIIPPGLNLKGTVQDAARFDDIARDFVGAYMKATQAAESCDPVQKRQKAAVYSEGLLKHGGPATDPVKAAMGEEWTAELFRQTLFGTGDAI